MMPTLTRRQRQIVSLICRGETNETIARQLGISPKTVDAHKASIKTVLGARDFTSILAYAIVEDLVPADCNLGIALALKLSGYSH